MRLIIGLLFLFLSVYCNAEVCIPDGEECIGQNQVKEVEGRSVKRKCWEYKTKYKCWSEEFKSFCTSIQSVPGCSLFNSICTDYTPDGLCSSYKKQFRCKNPMQPLHNESIIHLNTEYTISRDDDDISQCAELINNQNCVESSKTCVEGPETRVINGKEIFKECWKYDMAYSCFGSSEISDCQELEKSCQLTSEECLNMSDRGQCRHTAREYDCQNKTKLNSSGNGCKEHSYCIGTSCETIKNYDNKNMVGAISGLKVLKELVNEFDREGCNQNNHKDCKVFKGNHKHCAKSIKGAKNCCGDKGIILKMHLSECSEGERILATARSHGYCHYVGSYCSKKVKFLGCLERKSSYCCFESRMSRIIHEQGRSQLGISWGSASSPNCRALNIEELQNIDFSKFDFNEFYNEIHQSVNHGKISESIDSARRKVEEQGANYKQQENISSEDLLNRIRGHYEGN